VQLAQTELGEGRVVVTRRLDLHELKREDAVVLVHPERTLDTDNLAAFMRHGGRVILLDDYGTGEALLLHFGIQRVPTPRRPAESLRGNPSFAIAEPASAHPVVQDVNKVVTNHATGVRHPDLSPVLKIRGIGEPDVLVAEAGAVGQGRFLAVGDPSILISQMLRYPGNKAFARALVRYGVDDDTWGKRQGKLYIAAGDFEQKGTFGDDSPIADELNDWKRALKDFLEQIRRDGLPATLAYIVAVIVGLAIVIWVGTRAGKTHKPTPPRFTRTIPLVAQGGVAGHAAVIGAPATSRVLAMLELKSALEEDLCGLLDLDQHPGAEALISRAASSRLLEQRELSQLKALLVRMANVETLVIARRPAAIRDGEVVAAAAAVRHILSSAHQAARGGTTEVRS
jgi:hypothetical protein